MNETRVPLNKQPPRFWFICYNLILQLFSRLIRIRSRNDPDLQEALEGRRNLWERLEASLKSRNPGKPLVWFHVASAGEWLQAQPVIRRLSEKEVQCVLTYTSINARRWFWKRKETPPGVLVHEFIPLDTPSNAKRLLDLMAPDKIVWVSYDLWPNHIWEAAHRRIPQLLISGIVTRPLHAARISSSKNSTGPSTTGLSRSCSSRMRIWNGSDRWFRNILGSQ